MTAKSYCIGVDTGGTYTDGVLFDLASSSVVATVKKTTTHHDLRIGIGQVLTELLGENNVSAPEISKLAVSTTLATNAVVEGRGADVALFVIGYLKQFRLENTPTIFLEGGHDHLGREDNALDMEGLVDGLDQFRGFAEAYAVSSVMSIKNPAHEKVAQEAISMMDPGKPVFCSYNISERPGVKERASTAVLNARLMPIMDSFVKGIGDSLARQDLDCEVYIIRGDAKGMSIQDAVEQASSTVASGPAATAAYGQHLAENPDSIIVDVGGTTTDITMIRSGKPVLDMEGNLVGDWYTHVNAVAMTTVGIGGDSHVKLGRKGEIIVGPSRAQPLAMAPETPDPADWLGPELQGTWLSLSEKVTEEIAQADEILASLWQSGATTPLALREKFGIAEANLTHHIEKLVKHQLINEVGFTPTDALHCLGKVAIGDGERALHGAKVLAESLDIDVETFCKQVVAATEAKIEDTIIDHVLRHETGNNLAGSFPNYRSSQFLGVKFSIKAPIVGIGGAAPMLLPNVAKTLGTEVVCPEHYEVGNALGAVFIAR